MPPDKPLELQNIFRLDKHQQTGPASRGSTHAWQVRVLRDKKHHSKSFSDSKYGSYEASLEAAKQYRDQLCEELGIEINGSVNVLRDTLGSNNRTGIPGVNRSESLESNAEIREVWQTTWPSETEKVETASFSIRRFGEIGAMRLAIERRMEGVSSLIVLKKYASSLAVIRRLIDRYLDILCYLENISAKDEEFLKNTILNKALQNTTKEEIINGRIGQGNFKDKLLRLWAGRCSVTGATQLLNASHIKPWAAANGSERLDPFNGFLLSPVYDRAFDAGYITFTNKGRIVISIALGENVSLLNIDELAKIENINPFSHGYLQYHRDNIFLDEKNAP